MTTFLTLLPRTDSRSSKSRLTRHPGDSWCLSNGVVHACFAAHLKSTHRLRFWGWKTAMARR